MTPLAKQLLTLIAGISILTAGCAVNQPPPPTAGTLPERYNLPTVSPPQEPTPEGSIFNASAKNIYQDKRARTVGDIVLVKIVENSSGRKKASTNTTRESTVTGDVTGLLGFENWIKNHNNNFTPGSTSLQVGLKNDFDGEGETKRDSSVTATLSARVVDVTMDNNLVIRGYREVRVNNETQFLILSGIIRPQDISPDNSILSTHVADARIEFSGQGVISDKQQPGWLARALDVVWPF